ncbi:hypothetical protein [Peptostreptococcus faecalis]|nr:hypothetical protein [Peptostreptococcus faecalis]
MKKNLRVDNIKRSNGEDITIEKDIKMENLEKNIFYRRLMLFR